MPGYIDNSTDLALFESYSQGRAASGTNLLGVTQFAQWSSVLDKRTCDWCGWADERVFNTVTEPYDPPTHHGCRCLIAYIGTDEFPPTADWGAGPPKDVWPPGSTDKTRTPVLREAGKAVKPPPSGGVPLLAADDLDELLSRMTKVYLDVAEDAAKLGPGLQAGDLSTLTWSRTSGDKLLKEIYRHQGYDGPLKKVGTKAWGDIETRSLWRGMADQGVRQSPARFVKALTDGDYFPGFGVFGNGTYSAYGSKGRQVALQYAGGKKAGLVNFKLAKDARVVTETKLRGIQETIRGRLFSLQSQKLKALEKAESTMSAAKFRAAQLELRTWTTNTTLVLQDPGRLAAMLGYDAINVVQADFMIVLNRTKMVIA